MNRTKIFLALLICVLSAQIAFSQSQKEKDRATFVTIARALEKQPLDPKAEAARQWAFQWLAQTDEVTVVLCSEMMKLIPEKKNKFKGELLMQMTFGTALFKLENPDRKSDEKAANLAGAESMLRTYETIKSANEKAQNADLDALLVKRGTGELKTMIDAIKCEKGK